MTALVHALQWLTAVVWLVPVVLLSRKFYRVVVGKARGRDVLRLPMFCIAGLQVGFSSRWIAWPHAMPVMSNAELTFWALLYSMSIITALWVVRVHFIVAKLK